LKAAKGTLMLTILKKMLEVVDRIDLMIL
jgi:hypothetical protein